MKGVLREDTFVTILFRNHAVYLITWWGRGGEKGTARTGLMRFECWIIKATHIDSYNLIRIAFPTATIIMRTSHCYVIRTLSALLLQIANYVTNANLLLAHQQVYVNNVCHLSVRLKAKTLSLKT
jgi:hypothetical protein